jgi:hypothetical protein
MYVCIHKYNSSLFSEVLNFPHYPSRVYITHFTQTFVHIHLSPIVTVLYDRVFNISMKYSNRKDKYCVMDVDVILNPTGYFIYQDR